VYWVIALGFFTPGAVYAYIDPATTTYIIQIITALVVTVGVSLSVFMYRFRMISAKVRYGAYGLLYRLRNGKRPGRAVSLDLEGSAEQAAADKGDGSADRGDGSVLPGESTGLTPGDILPGSAHPPTEEEMAALGQPAGIEKIPIKDAESEAPWNGSYPERIKTALPVLLAVALSFFLIGCLDLAIQNAIELPFRPGAIVPALLLVTGLCFAILLLVIPVFRGLPYRILVSIAFSVLIAGYIQGNFMNSALGELTGAIIEWNQFRVQMAGSVIMWLFVFACVFLLQRYAKRTWRRALLLVSILLLVIQGVGLFAAVENFGKSGETSFWVQSEEMLTIEGLRELASEKNAIVFVVDRLDRDFVEQIEKSDPGFFNVLDGFTNFSDNITYNASTFPSVAGMLTGNRFTYDRPKIDYLYYAWEDAKMMQALKERGVDIRLFMDRGYAYNSTKQLEGLIGNINKGHIDFDKRIALVKLVKLSAFRYAPMPAKQSFWISPGEFGDALRLTDATSFYLTNDFAFYANITGEGLSAMGADKGFRYYHLNGSHEPFIMNENIERVEISATDDREEARIRQTMGCFKIIYEYLGQMRALGLYEDATIIITGDHPDYLGDELSKPMLTALFVKPAGSAGTPLAESNAPVCPDQLPGTVMEGLFGDRGGFPPGYMDMEEGADARREYNARLHRYLIEGDGRDFANWSFIGIYPDLTE